MSIRQSKMCDSEPVVSELFTQAIFTMNPCYVRRKAQSMPAIYWAFWAGMLMVVKFQVLPPSGVDMAPPVAPNAQLPECLKLWSASLSTTETSSQPVHSVSWF